MSDTDQLTESPELRELRDSLSSVTVSRRPSLASITARGRAHRRRRLSRVAGLSVVGVAAASALVVGLSVADNPARSLGTIKTASYTLRHNANGTDTLTLNPAELLDPSRLQSDLAAYRIPAKVTTGSFCTSDPEPAGFSQVVSGPGGGSWQPIQGNSSEGPTVTIDPAKLASGTELSVGNFQLPSGELQADMDLIDSGSYTCSSTPPTLGPATPGFGLLYGGQRNGGHTIQLAPGSN